MNRDRLSKAFLALTELVSRLRGPGGCPWDALQTDSTIKMYLLEETYEVMDAVERGSPEEVSMELGDLLFHIIFLGKLAEERGEFDLVEVIEKITEKMINRHPHVFGTTDVKGPEEVAQNWERIKKAEEGTQKSFTSMLQSIPGGLPALLRAHRLGERASKRNLDWFRAEAVWKRIEKGWGELRKAIVKEDQEPVGEEMGDLLFALVTLIRHSGLNAEHLLRNANTRFLERFQRMEEELMALGIDLDEATPDEMNRAWERVKIKRE
jgi:tetrapyrrole methylase family protein/MazG family protein